MTKYLSLAPALLLAAFLAFMGVQKFGAENIIFATIASKSGIGLFEPFIRTVVGASEIIVAILLLLPKARLIGAIGALAIIGGAIAFHLSPWLGLSVAMAPGAAPTFALFFMAVGAFILAAIALIIARSANK